jgi:hypothetical protein
LKGKTILAFFLPKFFGMKAGKWLVDILKVLLKKYFNSNFLIFTDSKNI